MPNRSSATVPETKGVPLLRLLVVLLVQLAWLSQRASAQEPTPQPQVYVVQPGDTLYSIAQRLGTTVGEIAAANGIADPRVIFVGQRLLIPQAEREATATPEAVVYVVRPGDTLAQIAERFGVSVEALAAANGIADASQITAGERLTIPIESQAQPPRSEPAERQRFHVIRAGELLPSLAFRYGTTVAELWAANRFDQLGIVLPGQTLRVPSPSAATPATPTFPELRVRPSPVVQGQTLLVEIRASTRLELSGQFLDQQLAVVPEDWGAWVLIGVDVRTDPGYHRLALNALERGSGDHLILTEPVEVSAGSFSEYNVVVPASRQGLLDAELSRAEREKVGAVFAKVTERPMWEGVFGLPMQGTLSLTASFGQMRSYDGGAVSSYHAGRDYDAETGTPVYATAAGTVVMAEPLQVRGQVVIIDHGCGVFTGFWHLSEVDAEVGQLVAPGEIVGRAGDTGLSTGSHLHWEMRVHGVAVDPIQWTQQAFP